MLASPLSLQEREASADDHEFITLSDQTVLGKGESFFLSSESCSQFVNREFVNSHFLSSLQFCHLMDISDASILKSFFSSRQFSMMSALLSSRFFIPAVDAIQIQTMRMSLSLKFTNASDEVAELKRPQEMRIDEFSLHKLRESHATIQELT